MAREMREEGSTRQRHEMGEGRKAMRGESFGIEALSGVQGHGDEMAPVRDDAKILGDHERAGPPMIGGRKGEMGATAHSDHGPHHHHDHRHEDGHKRHRV